MESLRRKSKIIVPMLPGMLHKEKKVEVPRSFKRVNYSIKAKESSNRSMWSNISSSFISSPVKSMQKRNAFAKVVKDI